MKFILTFLLCLCAIAGFSQTAEDSVKQTINNLFTAMKSSDAVLLQSVFAGSAILQTLVMDKKTGKIKVRNEEVKGFVEQISSLPKDAADERITFDMVKVNADLAIAWTPYQFYCNGAFSHGGVNSFQLVRLSGQWKIQYLVYTRPKGGCVQ